MKTQENGTIIKKSHSSMGKVKTESPTVYALLNDQTACLVNQMSHGINSNIISSAATKTLFHFVWYCKRRSKLCNNGYSIVINNNIK